MTECSQSHLLNTLLASDEVTNDVLDLLKERHFNDSEKGREVITERSTRKMLPILVYAYEASSTLSKGKAKVDALCKVIPLISGYTFKRI